MVYQLGRETRITHQLMRGSSNLVKVMGRSAITRLSVASERSNGLIENHCVRCIGMYGYEDVVGEEGEVDENGCLASKEAREIELRHSS